jgi:two-component system sensor kinase FixL
MTNLASGTSDVGWRERLDTALEAAVDGIVIIDATGTIETVNDAVVRMFGYRRQELLGRNVSTLMPEPFASRHDSYIGKYLRTGEAKIIGLGREVEGRRRDGTIFPLELSVGQGTSEDRRFFVGILRDISDRKAMEQVLRQREKELRQTLHEAPIPTLITDRDGSVLESNAACSAMFGFTPEECRGQNVLDLLHAEDARETGRVLARLARRETVAVEEEKRFIAKDGHVLHGLLHVGTVHDGWGRSERLVMQIIDRTRQVEAELRERETLDRLAHVNRLSTLGEMAAGIAHEVNQPLGAISNYAQACRTLIERGRIDPGRLSEILQKIAAQAERAGEVIRRLRTLARGQRAAQEAASLDTLVSDIVKLAEVDARLRNVRIQTDLESPLPPVAVDPVQIQQVVLNLLRNGMEAMEEAGSEKREIVLSTRRTSTDEVEVAVRDFGSGVDPAVAEEIMSPFVSTKSTGMGMGLAICQSIIVSHGGRLWFRPAEGGGTVFHFTLPIELQGAADGAP